MKHRIVAIATILLSALTLAVPASADDDSHNVDPKLTQHVDANENIAAAGEQVERGAGHIDLGPKLIDGTWELMARDDSEATPVWRHVSDMLYRVNDGGILQVPDDPTYSFIKDDDKKVWVVPQQEISGVVWLGWNTQDPGIADQVNGTVTLSYGGHDGPGQFTVFVQAGNFGAPQLLWTSDKDVQQPIDVDLHSHTHANWVFTEPGIHRVKLTASATLKDGSTVSDTQVLTFAVGSDTDATGALDETAAKASQEAQQDTTADKADKTDKADETTADTEAPAQESNYLVPVIIIGVIVIIAFVGGFIVVKRREKATKEKAKEQL